MQHVTLLTDDVRWSPRSEVDDALIGVLVDHLALARRQPAPIPGQPRYVTHATTEGNVLIATISRDRAPIVTLAVVPGDGDIAAIGRLLRARGEMPRPGPWCLVQLHATAVLVPREDLGWMGDYERCLAWVWLDTPTTGVQ